MGKWAIRADTITVIVKSVFGNNFSNHKVNPSSTMTF